MKYYVGTIIIFIKIFIITERLFVLFLSSAIEPIYSFITAQTSSDVRSKLLHKKLLRRRRYDIIL